MELSIYKTKGSPMLNTERTMPKIEWVLIYSIAVIGFIGTIYIVSNDNDLNKINHKKDQISMSIIQDANKTSASANK
jgi:hypothetical protein